MHGDFGEGFLAAPGQAADWRLVVLLDTALDAGVLDALPGSAAAAAERLDLDPHAVRVLLEALREWDVVQPASGGDRYEHGPRMVDADTADVVRHHARAIRRWSAEVPARLRGDEPAARQPRSAAQRERWLRALAVRARQAAPAVADCSLTRFPQTRRVLDVAGGHGEYGLELARRGLEVTLQDLPEMVELVERWPAIRDSGLQLFAGDVFERLPDGLFDLVLCAGFTHTMAGDRVAGLLSRLRAITAPGGGIAIQTLLRDQRPAGPIFAVQMLIAAGGGDTHGLEEYRTWLTGAGYGPPDLADPGGRALLLAGVEEEVRTHPPAPDLD